LLFAVFFAVVFSNGISKVGYPAPTFKADAVINQKFSTLDLVDYKGKWIILLFYPLDFTFVCPTEIISFSDSISIFKEINAEIIAISVDSKYSHLAWVNTPRKMGGLGKIDIPLVSDFPKKKSPMIMAYYIKTKDTLLEVFLSSIQHKFYVPPLP